MKKLLIIFLYIVGGIISYAIFLDIFKLGDVGLAVSRYESTGYSRGEPETWPVTTDVLKLIQESIETTRIQMDFEEVKILWPKVNAFVKEKGRQPELKAADLMERRLAECILWIKEQKRQQAQKAEA